MIFLSYDSNYSAILKVFYAFYPMQPQLVSNIIVNNMYTFNSF